MKRDTDHDPKLVEAVALALCEADEVEPDKNDFSCGIDTNWPVFEDMAKTAPDTLRANGVLNEGWQPIETAPKNDEFLAYDSHARKQDVCFAWGDHCVCQVQMDGENGPLSDEFGYEPKTITHWMPLPTPPKE